jgi:hypothetical protein
MAEQIGKYSVYSSNTSSKQRGSVTVRRDDGAIVARVFSARSQPLRFLRNWVGCEERLSLIEQLKENGVDSEIIRAILTTKDK